MRPPLHGVRVVEFEGIGPGPLASRMLADMGAQVTVVARAVAGSLAERIGGDGESPMRRGKTTVLLDLRSEAGMAAARELVAGADVLVEAFRPGVMERLGLGPEECAKHNPQLIYGRMTGWGQSGPLAQAAGHDLNYVALTGLLSLAGSDGRCPRVPPTVMGDATGALGLAFGIACALVDARASGKGRVVDAAIVDVLAMLGSIALWARANAQLDGNVPSPFHDSPFYDVYTCADGRFITVGALEPQFYALLLQKLGLADLDPARQYERPDWAHVKSRFAALFASHPLSHWCELLEGSDVCFAPVLSLAEAALHPHNVARGIYRREPGGGITAAAAPRYLPYATE